jgi:hypothetical protein
MNILIVTSKDHMYANRVLAMLAHSSVLGWDSVWVMEQSSLVPGKSLWFGLQKYIRISGIRYVGWQMIKQYWFLWHRWVAQRTRNTKSPHFPYWRVPSALKWNRETVNGVGRETVIARIKNFHPDYIVSVFSKEILSTPLLSIPSRGAVNLHPALLPSYRGVSPIFWCMVHGERRSGATLHYLRPAIDTGPIISQRSFSLDGYHTEHDVYMKSAFLGASLLTSWFCEGCPKHSKNTGASIRVQSSYYSLPTKQAVRQFFDQGYHFL